MRNLLPMLILIISTTMFSQDYRIDAQRPTLSESSSIIKSNNLQFENGVEFDFEGNATTSIFFRHTFFNFIETRVLKTFEPDEIGYSGKVRLFNSDNFAGTSISFIYTYNDGSEYKVVATKDLNRLSLTANYSWNDNVIGGRYRNLTASYLLYPDWSVFLEGQLAGTNDDGFEKTVRGGVVVLPYNSIQLDTFVGYGEITQLHAGVGFSFKINYGKKTNYQIEEYYPKENN